MGLSLSLRLYSRSCSLATDYFREQPLLSLSTTPGGLSWALDPSFCALMLPQFPEGAKSSWVGYNFVTCNDIRVALAHPAWSNAPTHPPSSARVWLLCKIWLPRRTMVPAVYMRLNIPRRGALT